MTDVGKMRREMKRRAVGRRAELVAGDGAPNVTGMMRWWLPGWDGGGWRSEGGGVVAGGVRPGYETGRCRWTRLAGPAD